MEMWGSKPQYQRQAKNITTISEKVSNNEEKEKFSPQTAMGINSVRKWGRKKKRAVKSQLSLHPQTLLSIVPFSIPSSLYLTPIKP